MHKRTTFVHHYDTFSTIALYTLATPNTTQPLLHYFDTWLAATAAAVTAVTAAAAAVPVPPPDHVSHPAAMVLPIQRWRC